jgi:hypothetical protein
MFGFGGDKERKAQKKRFTTIHRDFIDVEWRSNLNKLKKSFSDVWTDNVHVENLEATIKEGRRLTDGLNRKFHRSNSRLENFEEELDIIVNKINESERLLQTVMTDLLMKQTLTSMPISKK